MTGQDIFLVFVISIATNYGMRVGWFEDRKTALRDAKINYLYRKTGLSFDHMEALMPDIRKALESGQKIVAIKLYREASGCGLKEAKDAVENLMRGEAPPKAPSGPAGHA